MSEKTAKHHRLDSYKDFAVLAAFGGLAMNIREWARDRGFEEDVDSVKYILNNAEGVSEEEATRLCAFMETLFSIAQVGLIVSELGEFVESLRKPKNDDHLPDTPQFAAELADTFIRLGHLTARTCQVNTDEEPDIDIDSIIAKKMEYNESRPYKHGKTC